MTAPSEQIIELQGGKWKTRVLCAGEGDPVVFLHGAGGLHWDPFLDGLAEHFRIFAPEHLGSGDSQGIEHLYDILDLVLYYAELFDAMGLSAFSLIGHSFGGMVAAEIAAINPERVHKLALLAPLGLWQDEHPVPDISTIAPTSCRACCLPILTGRRRRWQPCRTLVIQKPSSKPPWQWRASSNSSGRCPTRD